jgi:3-methylcrotonyl-CoA carboxylase alpha subunit
MFSSLLVANRGEIACRVFRTARRLGLRTIAVFSDADRDSLHVAEADEAYAIGAPEARFSYLNGARIIEVAAAAKADAIHPGYGFLSENADFAEACEKRGIIFVGPSPHAIKSMGLKDEAKAIAQEAGVPIIPGYQGLDQSPARLLNEADKIGYPLIIKAIAGGGGRGMRIVEDTTEFIAALEACRREAKAAFGDDRVLLEKYFTSARHVEVQLIADSYGNVIHLYERDCSVQRRHQKIIEEAPAYGIPELIRGKMHSAAIAIAHSVNYRSAGTAEFLYDAQSGRFFFMEMNTRLQVEHPVTEMITGLDLVELQLRVAAGEKLPVKQAQIETHGHAIEARLYAEDPAQGFLPQTGIVHELTWPSEHANCRIDTGIAKGSEISSFYDSMIAKIIAWAPTRNEAIRRLQHALKDTFLFGLKTNKGFLLSISRSVDFAREAPTTCFLDEYGVAAAKPPAELVVLACLCWLYRRSRNTDGPWAMSLGWLLAGDTRQERHKMSVYGRIVDISATYAGRTLTIDVENERHSIEMMEFEGQTLRLLIDGKPAEARFHRSGLQLFVEAAGHHLTLSQPDYTDYESKTLGEGPVRAPMPGRVLKLEITRGAPVRAGDRLLVLEAMKMEHVLRAPVAGRVADISVAEGQQVREGDLLCIIGPEVQ